MVKAYIPILLVLLILILLVAALLWFLAHRRRWILFSLLLLICIGGPAYIVLFMIHPFGERDRLRIIASAKASDGTEIKLTQARNQGWAEPYTVSLWVRPAGRNWRWYYVDHQDSWWRTGKISINTEQTKAKIIKGGKDLIAELDLPQLSLKLADGTERANCWMSENWECTEDAEYRNALHEAEREDYLKKSAQSLKQQDHS